MGIIRLKKTLNKFINKYGINSMKTYKINQKVDDEIFKFYKNNNMIMSYHYENSIYGIKRYMEENIKIPTQKEWNKVAKNKGYLSSESLKYIARLKFEQLCKSI